MQTPACTWAAPFQACVWAGLASGSDGRQSLRPAETLPGAVPGILDQARWGPRGTVPISGKKAMRGPRDGQGSE